MHLNGLFRAQCAYHNQAQPIATVGLSEYRIPLRTKFSTLVQIGPGAQPAYCTMGTVFLSLR